MQELEHIYMDAILMAQLFQERDATATLFLLVHKTQNKKVDVSLSRAIGFLFGFVVLINVLWLDYGIWIQH